MGSRPRRVSLVNCPVNAEELCKGLASATAEAGDSSSSLCSKSGLCEPGSGPEDESEMTEEQIGNL